VVYGVLIERSSEIILLVVLLKRYFYKSTQPNSFGQILLSLRGHARQDVHAVSEVPHGMFLRTGKSHNKGQHLG